MESVPDDKITLGDGRGLITIAQAYKYGVYGGIAITARIGRYFQELLKNVRSEEVKGILNIWRFDESFVAQHYQIVVPLPNLSTRVSSIALFARLAPVQIHVGDQQFYIATGARG